MTRFAVVVLSLAVALTAGCNRSKSTITGTVTYEGSPVSRGQITFTPADGRGTPRSSPIEAGKYKVADVAAGKHMVQIIGVKAIHFATSHEELAQAAKSGVKTAEKADEIPADAIGNNQVVDTTLGSQERNFDLKRPMPRGKK